MFGWQSPMKLGLIFAFIFGVACQEKVIVGYYAPWSGVPVESMPFDKVTHINYAFGTLVSQSDPASIYMDYDKEVPEIKKLKALAKRNGVKVLISLGGWTGSQTFSLMAKDPKARTRFVDNALWFLRKDMDLDGIDLNWEFPGRQGAPCNAVDPYDSQNYLVLLRELRSAIDKEFPKRLLTAAVRVLPFDGPDRKPMANVGEFSRYFDFINIMSYDIMGPWSDSTGPNSPLHHDARGEQMSLSAAVQSWIRAGFPTNKITAGVAFYGRASTALVDMALDPRNQYAPKLPTTPKGDQEDTNVPSPLCSEGPVFSGEWKYRNIRTRIIGQRTTFLKFWDNTTMTPWLFDRSSATYISYDDPTSLKAKANYINQLNLRGVMIWDLGMDYNNELVNALQGIRSSNPKSSNTPTVTITITPTADPTQTITVTLPPTSDPTQTVTITATPRPTQTVTVTPTPTNNPFPTFTTTFNPFPTTPSNPNPTFRPLPNPCIPGTARCVNPGVSPLMVQCVDGYQWRYLYCLNGSKCIQQNNMIYCTY